MLILIVVLILIIAFIVYNKRQFKSIGNTKGICVEVKNELTDPYYSDSSDNAVRGGDRRMYRPYIKYEWQGIEYVAKSYKAYSKADIFPKDEVEIEVNDLNKEVVKIVRRLNK